MAATYTRRAVIDQLTFYSDTLGGTGAVQQGPVILAWTHAAGIAVGVETEAEQGSDTLAVLPASVSITGPTVFPNALVGHSVRESKANDAFDQGSSFSLSRGSMVVDFRPMGFGGELQPTELALALTQGDLRPLAGGGKELAPLPDAEQPDQTDPVGTEVRAFGDGNVPADQQKPRPIFDGLPDLQLFDHTTGRWVEFTHPTGGFEFRVPSPARYVDTTGAFSARFVNRGDQNNSTYFSLVVRLEGDAG